MLGRLIILLMVTSCAFSDVIDSDFVPQLQGLFKDRLENSFTEFLLSHNKRYENISEAFILERQRNFLENLNIILNHNKNNDNDFELGANDYSDFDRRKFVENLCRTELPANLRALPSIYPPTTPPKKSVNWNKYSLPIVDQEMCGSCWAFAATATIEYYNAIRLKWKQLISVQNLIDCDIYNPNACAGGWPYNAFVFLKNKYRNRLANDKDYPYVSGKTLKKGKCRTVKNYTPLNFAKPFQIYLNGNETALRAIVSNYGPVTVAMYVSDAGYFQNYKKGIIYDKTCPKSNQKKNFNQCSKLNHAVVIIGYGKDKSGKDYWLVRNSWGKSWGEKGYFRMAMNRGNNCNLACYAMGVE